MIRENQIENGHCLNILVNTLGANKNEITPFLGVLENIPSSPILHTIIETILSISKIFAQRGLLTR